MPTTYEKANEEQAAVLQALIKRAFGELLVADVTVTFMLARNPDGDAIKVHGCAAAAKIKVNGLADRAEGKGDVTLTVDEAAWADKNARQQEALLFHELLHLRVVKTKTGAVKRDDLGRPVVKTAPDSYVVNGFFECVERYGDDAHEKQTVKGVVGEYERRGLWEGE